MAAQLDEVMADLRALLEDVRHEAEHVGYGFFPGGDPRTFTPDPDASTEEERERHRLDCERVERGEKPTTETRCHHAEAPGLTISVLPSGYGLGTYTNEDPQMQDVAERLGRAIDQLEHLADRIERGE